MVTVDEFIKAIEATGHERILAVGIDRSDYLTEGHVASIAAECGVHFQPEIRRRGIDRGKVQWLVWLLTPEQRKKAGERL